MEITRIEAVAVEQAVSEATEDQVSELNDLQLLMIGGGIGEVIVA